MKSVVSPIVDKAPAVGCNDWFAGVPLSFKAEFLVLLQELDGFA